MIRFAKILESIDSQFLIRACQTGSLIYPEFPKDRTTATLTIDLGYLLDNRWVERRVGLELSTPEVLEKALDAFSLAQCMEVQLLMRSLDKEIVTMEEVQWGLQRICDSLVAAAKV